MPRKSFEPNVKLGDLLMLAKLGALHQEHGGKPPSRTLNKELNGTRSMISTALSKISETFGTVEVPGEENRTLTPSLFGRNIGGAAVVAELIIEIAMNPDTDQERVRVKIEDLIGETRKDYEAGKFKESKEKNKF